MSFAKGNLNRIWAVLGALDSIEDPTLGKVTAATGIPKSTVNDALKKILDGQVAGVKVKKFDAVYRIVEWSDFRTSVTEVFDSVAVKESKD